MSSSGAVALPPSPPSSDMKSGIPPIFLSRLCFIS